MWIIFLAKSAFPFPNHCGGLFNYLPLCFLLKCWFAFLFNLAQSGGLNVSVVVVACCSAPRPEWARKKLWFWFFLKMKTFQVSRAINCAVYMLMSFTESWFWKERGTVPRATIPLVTFIVTNYTTKTSGREGIIALGAARSPLLSDVQALCCFSITSSPEPRGCERSYLYKIE